MSPRHPLSKGPQGDSWMYWGGALLLVIFGLSIRWARGPVSVILPANPPAGIAAPGTVGPGVTTGVPSSIPSPVVAPPAPVVTAPPVAIQVQPTVSAVSPGVAPVVSPGIPPTVTQAASVARILPPFWKFSLPTAPVNAILTTPTGMLWAAVENGLVSIDGDQVSFLTRENGLFPAPSATCLAHDGTSLWVGTFEGLYKLSSGGSFEKFTTQEGLAHDMVWSLEWDGRILWVGTQAGFSFSLPDGRFERIDDKISNGGLADVWVKSIRRFERWTLCGNDEGVSVWDTAIAAANPSGWVTMDMFSTNLPHSFILTQLVAENQIWAGTPMGLSRLEIPVDKLFGGVVASWKTFNRSNGLPDNRVDALALAGRDLWVGTPAGLARYRSGLFRNMGYADGLLASDVRALHVAGDRLWVGTSGGFQALDFAAVN